MANEFDPYREALVVETSTHWPDGYQAWDEPSKDRIAQRLHAAAAEAAELKYDRMHTGFARVITVTPADLKRLGVS